MEACVRGGWFSGFNRLQAGMCCKFFRCAIARQVFLVLTLVLLLAALITASANVHASPDRQAPVFNPTGRLLEMSVPLNYKDYYLGDMDVRITPEQDVLVKTAPFLAAVQPLLRENAFHQIKAASENAGADYVALKALRQAGFDLRFDPGAVSIRFLPTLEQKAKGNVSVQARRKNLDSPNAVKPSPFSAYMNLRGAIDYVSRSPASREGLRAPRLDLEMAARWQGIVFETEATYVPDEVALFGEAGAGLKRRGSRIVYDMEDAAIRAKIGDIYPIGTSFQQTPDLLGLSVERSYGKLQPGRNIRATSRRTFRIERPSSVDVQVNGVTVRRLRLDAGDYDLSDLPVSTGVNDIALLIEDDVGNRRKLDFTVFLDNDLMEPGLTEWAFAAGLPSDFENSEPEYHYRDLYFTGFYRRGLLENLTGELHLQGDASKLMGGAGVLLGSSLGLVSLEAAASMHRSGMWGAALDAYYSAASFTDFSGREHRLRFSAKARTPDFSAAVPDSEITGSIRRGSQRNWLTLSGSYGSVLPFHIGSAFSAGYAFAVEGEPDSYHADLTLSRNIGQDLSMALSGGLFASGKEETELSLSLRLNYRLDETSSLSMQHDAGREVSNVTYNRRHGQGVGSWRTEVSLTREAGQGDENRDIASVEGAVQYTGNRATIALFQDSGFAGLGTEFVDQRTALRVETALGFAGGHLAVGRPITNGFAIIAPHAGLADKEIRLGTNGNSYQARTDWLGAALVPSLAPYRLNRIDYDVDDLPPGYDLGEGLFDMQPGYKSGYGMTVGSSYTVTALGTLLDRAGKPVSLLTGQAVEKANPAKKVELFTNRSGRFAAQGLAPGRWTLEVASTPPLRYAVEVPAETVGIYRFGNLKPIGETP